MRALLLQLSDIHIRSGDDPVIRRRALIARAVASLDPDIDACLLLLTGDIANTGSGDEYYVALDFIGQLQKDLRDAFGGAVSVHTAVIPGNHDCDFRVPIGARDLLRASLASNPLQPVDDSI